MATQQQFMDYDFKPSIDTVIAHLKKLDNSFDDFREPLKKCISEVVIPSIKANFAAQGRPPWKPWAQSTIDFHKMLNESMSTSLLVHTGELRSTMSTEGVWTITKDEAYIADLPQNIWYGKVHQGGYPGGNSNGPIPARPFVLLTDDEYKKIDAIFYEWLGVQIEKAWPV